MLPVFMLVKKSKESSEINLIKSGIFQFPVYTFVFRPKNIDFPFGDAIAFNGWSGVLDIDKVTWFKER